MPRIIISISVYSPLIALHDMVLYCLMSDRISYVRWALQHGVIEGMAVLLQQKGCGWYASLNAMGIVAVYVFGIFWFFFFFFAGGNDTVISQLALDAVLLVFYGLLWLLPSHKLFRRPALLVYAKIWFVIRVPGIILHIGLLLPHTVSDWPDCGYYFFRVILFSLVQPLISYHVMYLDSLWWQGIDVVDGTERPSNRFSSFSGDNSERPSFYSRQDFSLYNAQAVASVMDRIGIEENVRMLNFAYLGVRKGQLLGKGSFSTVYRGTYKRQVVAVKRIDTADLTIDIIHRVASEASILSSIQHVNVVGIYGVALMPPSIYIVLELCKYGSLGDVIRPGLSSGTPPLNLSTADEVWLALGCARGLHAVHSFGPTLCHRDVKSFNFLVDCQFNVKIADLELGDTKGDIKREEPKMNPFMRCPCFKSQTALEGGQSYSLEKDNSSLTASLMSTIPPGLEQVHPDARDLQPMWLAPEVLKSGRWSQASDIYSLSMVLWELRSRQYPFEGCRFNVDVQREILAGYRHHFPSYPAGGGDAECFAAMEKLISSGWAEVPSERPTSGDMIKALEDILYCCCVKATGSHSQTAVTELHRSSVTSAEEGRLERPKTLSHWFLYHSGPWAMLDVEQPFHIRFKSDAWISSMQNIYSIASSPSSSLITPEMSSLPICFADAGFYIPSVDAPGGQLRGSQSRSRFIEKFSMFLDSIVKYKHGHIVLSNETKSASHLSTAVEFSLHAFVIQIGPSSSGSNGEEKKEDSTDMSTVSSICSPSRGSVARESVGRFSTPSMRADTTGPGAPNTLIAVVATDILELRRGTKHVVLTRPRSPPPSSPSANSDRMSTMEIKPVLSDEPNPIILNSSTWDVNNTEI